MSKRLCGLDALRGIAAFVVALHHLRLQAGQPGIPLLPFLAVDLFFVLSGFVMARTYEDRLRTGLTTAGFIRLRYRRLFLPLAIGTTAGLLWALAVNPVSAQITLAYALALAFLPAFWLTNAFPFNIPAWSLFLEIVSNALHGAIFAKMSRRAIAVALVVCGTATGALLANGYAIWSEGFWPILSCLPRELSFYLAGILLYRTCGDAPFDFGGRWALWLGAVSYPLYATHVPVMHLAGMAGLNAIEAFALALWVAVVITAFVEVKRPRRSLAHAG